MKRETRLFWRTILDAVKGAIGVLIAISMVGLVATAAVLGIGKLATLFPIATVVGLLLVLDFIIAATLLNIRDGLREWWRETKYWAELDMRYEDEIKAEKEAAKKAKSAS